MSVATEVVTHQLAVLETCGRGVALITVPQTVACDRSGETQAGDLGPTLQLRVDLKQEQSTACAVTASALPCCAYGDVPKAVHLVPFTCGEYCSRPPRCMVEIWVYLCMYSSADLFGCSSFPLLAVGVQDMQGQQSCMFPLNFILFCQIRECRKETRKMKA